MEVLLAEVSLNIAHASAEQVLSLQKPSEAQGALPHP